MLTLLSHQLNVAGKVLASVYGWLFALAAFFAPERYAFTVVLVAILLDALFGILVSVKAGNFILSKLGRQTFLKIASYGSALVMLYMVEKMAHDGTFIGVRAAAALAAACEFWSLSASVLILWPDAPFFRILRGHLKGEIAAKLGDSAAELLTTDKAP